MPQDPLGLVYRGIEGTGAAGLTTKHDTLDPQGLHWQKLQQKQQQEQAEKQAKAKAISDIDKLAGTGWYPHREFVNNKVDQLRAHVTDAYMKGQDPFKGEYGAKTYEMKRDITDAVETSKYLKEYYEDVRQQYDKDPDKYELESFDGLRETFYDLEGVMTGEREIGHLVPKKEKMKWYDRYSKIDPTYRSSTIEKGDVTTTSKSFNTKNAIATLQDEFLQMDDLTDIVTRYPDAPPEYNKEDAKWQPYIEAGYEAYSKVAESLGQEVPVTKNQYEQAIYDGLLHSKSKASTEYKRLEDEPKKEYGWDANGYKTENAEVFRGGQRNYEITTAQGKRINSVALDEYALGGKKQDKPIRVDASRFIDMSTGGFMKDESGRDLVGDQQVSLTNLLMVAVDENGKIQATGDPDKIKRLVENDPNIFVDWYGEGTMYTTAKGEDTRTERQKEIGTGDLPKEIKVEKKVMVPYDNIKSKIKSSYDGFELEERPLSQISDIELYSRFKKANPGLDPSKYWLMVWETKNEQ